MKEQTFEPNPGKEIGMVVDGVKYLRLPIKTRLIQVNDDLMALLREYMGPHLQPGDLIFVSEKIVCITQGRIVRMRDIKPSWLARFLSKRVNNRRNTADFRGFGHGTNIGMQVFIDEAGYPRVIFAAAVSALTRPFGIQGLFYTISGKMAKSVDCPMSFTMDPYMHYAKLAPADPNGVAKAIRKEFGNDAVIVDANYRGAFSLGKSNRSITESFIQKLLKDNPAGQSEEMTPFFIIRKA